jgi:uncharacterized Zn finger protein (UPF0148 family)
MSDFEEDDWTPPSEAELKVLAAKRERSDKISKRIGDYLLKGYKMLASSCEVCYSIELEDKEGQIYCVACQEIDCHETSKDDPVLNAEAAEKVIAESAFSSSGNRLLESINPDVVPGARFSQAAPPPPSTSRADPAPSAIAQPASSSASNILDLRYADAMEEDDLTYVGTGARPKVALPTTTLNKCDIFGSTHATLVEKLHWASQQLVQESRVPQADQLVHLIKSLLEAIKVVNDVK